MIVTGTGSHDRYQRYLHEMLSFREENRGRTIIKHQGRTLWITVGLGNGSDVDMAYTDNMSPLFENLLRVDDGGTMRVLKQVVGAFHTDRTRVAGVSSQFFGSRIRIGDLRYEILPTSRGDEDGVSMADIGVAATAEDLGVMALIAGLLNPEDSIAASSPWLNTHGIAPEANFNIFTTEGFSEKIGDGSDRGGCQSVGLRSSVVRHRIINGAAM